MMPFKRWKYTIANGMTCEQQKHFYHQYAVPESKLIIRGVFKCKTIIDFSNHHVPILFTSGIHDQIVPSSLNYSNYQKYKMKKT